MQFIVSINLISGLQKFTRTPPDGTVGYYFLSGNEKHAFEKTKGPTNPTFRGIINKHLGIGFKSGNNPFGGFLSRPDILSCPIDLLEIIL